MSNDNQHWSNTQERGTVIGIKILLWVYRLFGRKILWIVMFPVVAFMYITGSKARKASSEFFNNAHRTDSRVAPHSFYIGLKHFCCFADAAFDKLDAWLGEITRDDIHYNDKNVFPNIVKNGRGAIFIGSHLGNLDVCRALGQTHRNVAINVMVFTAHAVKFNEALQGVNQDFSVNLIQVDQMSPAVAMMLKDKVDNGEIIVIVGDRTSVTTNGRVEYVPFLGETAAFAQGPFILASLLSCPVYWLFCFKEKNGFKVIFEHVSEAISLPRKDRKIVLNKLITSYVKRLEYYAIRYPFQWFNFYNFWQNDDAVRRNNKSED